MLQEFGPESGGGGADEGGGGMGGETMGGGPGESAKEAFEISPEAAKKFKAQQAAVKKLWQEEQKFKQDDNKVASIIIKFLHDPAHAKFFILIARLVGRNLPSPFLLAILALIHQECAESTQEEIKSLPSGQNPEANSLELREEKDFKTIPPDIKKQIDEWVNNIYKVGSSTPHKIYHALSNPDGSIEDSFFQLGTFVLQEFLDINGIKNEYEEIRGFIDIAFNSMMNKYKKVVDDQRMLQEEKAAQENKPEENQAPNQQQAA